MEEAANGGPAIHVLFRKEELDPVRIAGKALVVVDVLFATTSIVTALDRGVSTVYPVRDADEALALAHTLADARQPGRHEPVLSGEAMFRFIDGFAPPTPLALAKHLAGRDTLIYTTTNGTVALRAGAGAGLVLAGSLINADATAGAVDDADPGTGTVVVLCAGTAGAFNVEDFYGAGCLVDRISERRESYRLTDAALAARNYFRSLDAGRVLRESYVGRLMQQWDLDEEVAYAARVDSVPVVAALRGERIERV